MFAHLSHALSIVEVLSKSGIMDKRGTGFLRIREAMKRGNLPEPEFKEKQNCFVIRFNNPAIEKIPEVYETGLNERQRKAVEYLKEKGRITNREYREINSVSNRIAFEELSGLTEKRILAKKSRGRSVYYVFG